MYSRRSREELFATTILASAHPDGLTLHTQHWRSPRLILAEINKHRSLPNNARSSRAVPIKTMLDEVQTKPFVPWYWTRKNPGMQGPWGHDARLILSSYRSVGRVGGKSLYELVNEEISNEYAWLKARDQAVKFAQAFADADYHKQVANRLLEPFMWVDVLVTGVLWKHFLRLRDHAAAEPHFQDLAREVRKALESAEPQALKIGDWHLPYITDEDWTAVWTLLTEGGFSQPSLAKQIEVLQKLSAARSARISYEPFDGNPSIGRELERYESLMSDPMHATPVEHQATPDSRSYYKRVKVLETSDYEEVVQEGLDWDNPTLHGPLTGWVQYRKILPNEAVYG